MDVFLISGLWPTSDECGLVPLATKIESLSLEIKTKIYHYDDKNIPLSNDSILIGHSLGGEICVNRARQFQSIRYMALIEPVHHSWFPIFFWVPGQHFTVPNNVQKCDVFKRQKGWLPPSSKCLNPSDRFQNYSIDCDHANAPRHELIVGRILESVKSVL